MKIDEGLRNLVGKIIKNSVSYDDELTILNDDESVQAVYCNGVKAF